MKKGKARAAATYLAAALFYLSAVLDLTNDNTSMGVISLALGSTFLCLGAVNRKKADGSDDDDRKNQAD